MLMLAANGGTASAAAPVRPSAPRNVVAIPGYRSAIVRWTVPRSNHGSTITHYRVIPYLAGVKRARTTVGAVTEARITLLKNASRYTFRVVAVNAQGDGPAASSPAVIIGAPTAPSHVTARVVGNGVALRWNAPTTNNGSAISGYIVTPSVSGAALTPRTFKASASWRIVNGLSIGKNYTFTVVAKNGAGISPPSPATKALRFACVGVPMTSGQSDITRYPPGTTFCLSGVHNWTLTPKSGDQLLGPAVLDGGNTTHDAIEPAHAKNVVLSALEIRNYAVGNQQAAIQTNPWASGWILQDLSVHDNGSSSGGAGVSVGPSWRINGGRYYNNRQSGMSNAVGNNSIVTGAEIDHNNYTNDSYTTRNVSCAFEAGGYKWAANNVAVVDSRIHDNACVGLWMDINSRGATLRNNRVYNNWDEGILIEISSGARISYNTVSGNGFKSFRASCSASIWLYGGGITLAASDHNVVAHNAVSGNCNGITGTQENRPDGHPGLLEDNSIHDNIVSGPGGKTGVGAFPASDLASRNITFVNNSIDTNNMTYCSIYC